MFEKTKALCDSFLEMGVPGFDLMICKDGQCILRYMNGYSDRHYKTPMKGDEQYNIYSCSKVITCVALLQLWEKGMFKLEDKLSKYMPEFEHMTVKTEDGVREAKNPILIENLFTMTAGLNYNIATPALRKLKADTAGRCPTREVARAIAEGPLEFEPGTQYLYSLAHDVLAALLEVLTGEKFEDYVREHIFQPLGMTRTDFLLPMEEYRNIIPLYRGCEDGSVIPHFLGNVPSYRIGIEHASGGAGCASTVEDYMKFLEALRTGEKLLKRETIRMMATDRLTPAQREGFKLRQNYGYGLGVRVADEGSGRYDYGWGGAAGAYLAVDETHNMTMYYAQHVILSPNVDQRGKIYTTVLEELEGIIAREQAADPELNKLTY